MNLSSDWPKWYCFPIKTEKGGIWAMENDGESGQKGGPAAHFTEGIDQLCDLIISRLEERQNRGSAFQAGCRRFESGLPLHRHWKFGYDDHAAPRSCKT